MNLLVLTAAAVVTAGGSALPWTDLPIPGGARGLAAAAGLDPSHPAWAVPADIAVRLHAPEDPAAHALDRPRTLAYLAAMPPMAAAPDRAPLPLGEALWRSTIVPPEHRARPLVAAILLDPPSARLYRALLALDADTLQALGAQPAALGRLRASAGALALFSEGFVVKGGVVDVPGGPPATAAWEALVGGSVRQPVDFLEKLAAGREGRLLALHHVLATMPAADAAKLLTADAAPAASASALDDLARVFDAQPAWWLGRPLVSRPALTADEIVRLAGQRGGADASRFARALAEASPDEARARFAAATFAARVFAGRTPGDVEAAARTVVDRPALALALERSGVVDPALYVSMSAAAAAAERHGVVEVLQAALAVRLAAARPGALTADDVAALTGAVADREPVRALARAAADAWSGRRRAAAAPASFTWEGVRYGVDPGAAEARRVERWTDALGAQLGEALAAPPGDAATRRLARELRALVYVADAPESDALLRGAPGLLGRHDVPAGDPWRLPAYVAEGAGGRVSGALLGLDVALSRFDLRRASLLPVSSRLPAPVRQAVAETLALTFPVPDASLPAAVRDAIQRGAARVTAPAADLEAAMRDAGIAGWRRGAVRWLAARGLPATDPFTLHELAWLGGLRPDVVRGYGAARGPAGPQGQPWFGPPPRWEMLDRTRPAAARLADPALLALRLVAERELPAAVTRPLLAHVVQWMIDEGRPAHEVDGAALSRALRRFDVAQQDDAIAALVDGVLVPEGTATPGGDAP